MTTPSCHLCVLADDLVESSGTQLKRAILGTFDRLCNYHYQASKTTELNTGHLNRWTGKLASWYGTHTGSSSDLYSEPWTICTKRQSILCFARDLKSVAKRRNIPLDKYSKVRQAIKKGSEGISPGLDAVPDGYVEEWEGEEVETMLSEILRWRFDTGMGMLVKDMMNREEVTMLVSASLNQLSST